MPNPNAASAASFQNAEAYERVMGRWSRRLAPLLIRFGGLSDGDRVLDVGCGTGSLTFALPEMANIAAVIGIDLTEPFVEFARIHNTDPRISFQSADARVQPFEDNSFDRAFSMLVLQFGGDASGRLPRRDRAGCRVGRLQRPPTLPTDMGHGRCARSVHRPACLPANEQTKRNGDAMARAWFPRCRADQPCDPNGVLLIRRLLASFHQGRRPARTVHHKPFRRYPNNADRACAAGLPVRSI
jgi:SAM-dependent methyltransferase